MQAGNEDLLEGAQRLLGPLPHPDTAGLSSKLQGSADAAFKATLGKTTREQVLWDCVSLRRGAQGLEEGALPPCPKGMGAESRGLICCHFVRLQMPNAEGTWTGKSGDTGGWRLVLNVCEDLTQHPHRSPMPWAPCSALHALSPQACPALPLTPCVTPREPQWP